MKRKRATRIDSPKTFGPILLDLLLSLTFATVPGFMNNTIRVGLRTVLKPGEGDSSILRLGDGKYVAMSMDGNSRRCYFDPYQGTLGCISEAVRNVICSGASPIGLIDHLQFGSPENPEVFWTFQQAVAAIKDYCDFFTLPVIGEK